MPHRFQDPGAAGPEMDNVVERQAGLRSLSEACRMLDKDPQAVQALIAEGALPNAYQTDGQWRIPLDDLRPHMAAGGAAPLVRRPRPHESAE